MTTSQPEKISKMKVPVSEVTLKVDPKKLKRFFLPDIECHRRQMPLNFTSLVLVRMMFIRLRHVIMCFFRGVWEGGGGVAESLPKHQELVKKQCGYQ